MSLPEKPEHTTPAVANRTSAALDALRARTPARLVVGRAGTSYRTSTQLSLREDHAAAIDAVHADFNASRDLGAEFVERHQILEVGTQAVDKAHYLLQPESGRRLSEAAAETIRQHCPRQVDLQIGLGDGLSAAAVIAQAPELLPLLEAGAAQRGWTLGRPVAIRFCRVGVLNDLGELIDPQVVVLLIGERPGLATATSLSAYMAYQPRAGHTDAERNLISNIHERGVSSLLAAERILNLAQQMREQRASGVAVKEHLPDATLPRAGTPQLPPPR